MIPRRREAISQYAHRVLGDGDDIHMTESFAAAENEENSSTIANASVAPSSLALAAAVPTASSEKILQVDPKQMEATGDAIEVQDDRMSRRVSVKGLLSQLKESRRFLPWRLRQARAAAFRPHGSLNIVHEYQEVQDEEIEATQADSETIASLRSSRYNHGNGKSMMVRQNAQVFGRPSAAETKWDVSSLHSSNISSASSTRSLRQRSITLDNSSCVSGMSDITEEPTLVRLRRLDRDRPASSARRHPMFIHSHNDLARETFCIEEDEESEAQGGELGSSPDNSPDSDILHRSYDFRKLEAATTNETTSVPFMSPRSATTHDLSLSKGGSNMLGQVLRKSQTREMDVIWDLLAEKSSDEGTSDSTPVDSRQRIFSDSDIVFEQQRQRSKETEEESAPSSPSWFSNSGRQCSGDISSRRRTATYSHFTFSEAVFGDWSSQSNATGSDIDTAAYRARAQSDSFLQLPQPHHHDIKVLPRHRSLLDEDGPPVQDFSTLFASNRSSGSTGSSVSKNAVEVDSQPPLTENQVRMLEPSSRSSSPRTLKAASRIAAALRPATAPTLAPSRSGLPVSLHTRMNQKQAYYWSQDTDSDVGEAGNELTWAGSFGSFDDIL